MHIRSVLALAAIFFMVIFNQQAQAKDSAPHRYKAVAFDYFVIFDPISVLDEVERVLPGKGLEFTKSWRSKQFEYCFLRSITNDHADFSKVTADALDYTAEQMHFVLKPKDRERLLDAYLNLKPWPDSVSTLKKLRAAGIQIIAISNFSPEMLRENAEHAGITDLFDELLSTESNGTFKPDPNSYSLGLKALGLDKREIVFAAFGGWDAYGAKKFGYPTVWVNRLNVPGEKLGTVPDRTTNNLDGLLEFVLGTSHE